MLTDKNLQTDLKESILFYLLLAFYGIKLTTVSFEQKLLILKTTEELIVTNVGLKNKEGCNLHQADLFKEKQITWIFPLKDLLCSEQKIEIEH